MRIVPRPFADFLNVTFPRDAFEEAVEAVVSVCAEAGGVQVAPGVMSMPGPPHEPEREGVLKFGRRFGTGYVSLSGVALARLRSLGKFETLLCAIGAHPHRVTTLHCTLDVAVDARTIVHRLYQRGKTGRIHLTRNRIPPGQCSAVLRGALYGPGNTGTVYLGSRRRDVWAKVYDKRNEILDRQANGREMTDAFVALIDPGPLTRYELALGRHVGVTLRDAAEPEAAFWSFMGESIMVRPEGVPEWRPAAEGYALPPPPPPDYWRQLELLLERSPDVSRLLSIADRLGPHGRTLLLSKLRDMVPRPLIEPEPLQAAQAV